MAAPAWEDAWNRVQIKLTSIHDTLSASNPAYPRVLRVGQLDSELLDQELAQLLQDPLNKALSLINTSLKTKFEPELSLLIHLTLYKLSIWNSGASYGAKLQDLRYVVPTTTAQSLAPSGLPRKTLFLHGTATILLPYLHNRFRSHALSNAWPDVPSSDRRRQIWDLLSSVESAHTAFGLLNFIAFLYSGKYRTLADRVLKMTLTPSRRLVKRDVSYEFMNRQMVWHAFTEFLLFLLPLISARTMRRRFYRLASYLSPSSLISLLPSNPTGVTKGPQTRHQKRGKFWSLPEDHCAICAENASFNLNLSEPTNMFTSLAVVPQSSNKFSDNEPPAHPIYSPYITSCGHIYCYHCIAERLIRTADEAEDDLGWECLRCGDNVKSADRYIVDVFDSESGSDDEFRSDMDMDVTDMSGSVGSYSGSE